MGVRRFLGGTAVRGDDGTGGSGAETLSPSPDAPRFLLAAPLPSPSTGSSAGPDAPSTTTSALPPLLWFAWVVGRLLLRGLDRRRWDSSMAARARFWNDRKASLIDSARWASRSHFSSSSIRSEMCASRFSHASPSYVSSMGLPHGDEMTACKVH